MNHYTSGKKPPLCEKTSEHKNIVVYWGVAWRSDQKDISLRNDMVKNTINDFFQPNDCFGVVSISATVTEKIANKNTEKRVLRVTDEVIINDARRRRASKAIIIRVEELGPNLMIYLSPILWQTQNEVLLHLRSLDVEKSRVETVITSHWKRGGAFTVIGAKSLPQDLKGVLSDIFYGVSQGADKMNARHSEYANNTLQ